MTTAIKRLERKREANRRALDKLRHRGPIGRNAGATEAAIDRRLAADLRMTRELGAMEEVCRHQRVAADGTIGPVCGLPLGHDGAHR